MANNTMTVTGNLNADMRELLSFYMSPSDVDYYVSDMELEPIPVETINSIFDATTGETRPD